MSDPTPLQWLPAQGRAEQLMILLHGVGSAGRAFEPLAQRLRAEFPQAAVMAPDGFEPFDMGTNPEQPGRQWFSVRGVDEANRVPRVAAVLPRLADWVRAAQQRSGVGPAATALVGFSQGGILALELAQLHDGLVGRVLAFAARYAVLPDHAPAETTLHLFHGADDAVIPAQQSRLALAQLAALNGDATVDIAEGIGHELAPVLVERALFRLRNHIPHRTWAAAMGQVPGLAARQDEVD
jgi:phospholipase/carboxylesterase